MKINLQYEVKAYFKSDFINEYNIEFNVDLNLQEILEFEFYKKYNKEYSPIAWHLEMGAKEFVKELEAQWLKNKIDDFSYLRNDEFISFLREKYQSLDFTSHLNFDDIVDDIELFLQDDDDFVKFGDDAYMYDGFRYNAEDLYKRYVECEVI